MTDLDRLLELYFIQTPNQFSDEYNKLKSKIEHSIEDSLGDKQQIGDLLAICDMKDEEIKQLKEERKLGVKLINEYITEIRELKEILRGKEE